MELTYQLKKNGQELKEGCDRRMVGAVFMDDGEVEGGGGDLNNDSPNEL